MEREDETPPVDGTGHLWHERIYSSMRIMCCMNCGFIKNPDKPNKKCPGPIRVALRASAIHQRGERG